MSALEYESALTAITSAIEEVNLSREEDDKLSLEPDEVLYGDGSSLDSIGLVQVVMTAEQHISENTGLDIVLASEAAMSRRHSPYRSVRRLAEYAVEVASEEAGEK